jgi:hypothetical protein
MLKQQMRDLGSMAQITWVCGKACRQMCRVEFPLRCGFERRQVKPSVVKNKWKYGMIRSNLCYLKIILLQFRPFFSSMMEEKN